MVSGPAVTQSVEVEIDPESRGRIKEYVVREKVAPVRVRERVDVGTILPEDVVLREVPSDWGPWGSRYRYVYSADGKVYPGRAVHPPCGALDRLMGTVLLRISLSEARCSSETTTLRLRPA